MCLGYTPAVHRHSTELEPGLRVRRHEAMHTTPRRILLLAAALSSCAYSQKMRLRQTQPAAEAAALVAIEDARAAEEKGTRITTEGGCLRSYGDAFVEPSKVEYLRGLLAERLAPTAKLAIRVERFDTLDHCEASSERARRHAMQGALFGVLGVLIAQAVDSGKAEASVADSFELHLAGAANGRPFTFRRTFEYSGFVSEQFPAENEEFRRRVDGLFHEFATELGRTLGAGAPAPDPSAAPVLRAAPATTPGPATAPVSTPARTASSATSAAPAVARASAPPVRAAPAPYISVAPPSRAVASAPIPSDLAQELEDCRSRDAAACARAARRYGRGEGVTKDGPRAAALYKRACDGGHGESCNLLGRVQEAGDPKPDELQRAVALYQQSCDAACGAGCLNLSRLYRTGRGVRRDAARAAELLQRACDAGEARACEGGAP